MFAAHNYSKQHGWSELVFGKHWSTRFKASLHTNAPTRRTNWCGNSFRVGIERTPGPENEAMSKNGKLRIFLPNRKKSGPSWNSSIWMSTRIAGIGKMRVTDVGASARRMLMSERRRETPLSNGKESSV